MKDHTIIGNLLDIYPTEEDLVSWINSRWKPKGHIELKLRSKGFFTMIFHNQGDKERVF
jgi:hypothetical protein